MQKGFTKGEQNIAGGITVSKMTVFRQSAADLCFVDSCILINILEFAASFENASLISQTCREWNEIINKNKLILKVYGIGLPMDNAAPMNLKN